MVLIPGIVNKELSKLNRASIQQEQIKKVDSIQEIDSFVVIGLSYKINEMLAIVDVLLKNYFSKYVHTTQNNIRELQSLISV